MKPDADPRMAAPGGRGRVWIVAIVPLLLLAALVAVILWWGPADALRGDNYPPVERLTFQRVELRPDGILVALMNDGPDPVKIAQVQVDEAYWSFSADRGGTELDHLGRTELRIPYPWVHGEAHVLRIVTSTGVTFDHEIAVAVPTPQADLRSLGLFTMLGIYVGVLPVAIGLLWFPLVSRLGPRPLDFVLALTIGLLLFLLVDATDEGLEIAREVPDSFQGTVLFIFGALGAYLALETLAAWLKSHRCRVYELGDSGWMLALLVAIGIGLHNFGEGLAIGAAFTLGEAALGTVLIIGFTLHNTTEGLAIVAPLSRSRVRTADLVKLGLIGGVPTIAGAWLGGVVYSPLWSVLFLAVGAGAIAQVVVQITRQMAGDRPVTQFFAAGHVMAGLLAGFVVMYATGMMVG
ncbi:MAG: metal transporter [Acidobacteria bacterium]|nr:metal transporter [Acidobacteriota bacterium]